MRLAAFLTVLLGLSSSAGAQSYSMTKSTRVFESIYDFGTEISFPRVDDGSRVIEAPFPFFFFGRLIEQGASLGVNSNGMLAVGFDTTEFHNTAIPSALPPDGFIASYWDDVENGRAFQHVIGSVGHRVLTVEWYFTRYWHASGMVSTQIKIFEEDSHIEIGYRGESYMNGDGSIGVEDFTGQKGVGFSCSPVCTLAEVPPDTLLTFRPIFDTDLTVQLIDPLPTRLEPGMVQQLSVKVENVGTSSSSTTSVAIYAATQTPVNASGLLLASAPLSPLAPRASRTVTLDVRIPDGTAAGTYNLAVLVDPSDWVPEMNDNNNNAQLGSVVFGGPLANLVSASIPLILGRVVSHGLRAEGGHPPYTWSVEGTLPAGINLEGAALKGTPTAVGNSNVTFVVSDSMSEVARMESTIRVTERTATPPGEDDEEPTGCDCRTSSGSRDLRWLAFALAVAAFSRRARKLGRPRSPTAGSR